MNTNQNITNQPGNQREAGYAYVPGRAPIPLPEAGGCDCIAYCCPMSYHADIQEFLGKDRTNAFLTACCIQCQPVTGPKACCGLFGPDLHGFHHGATAGVQLRRKYNIVESSDEDCCSGDCAVICFSACCPVCAIKNDHNIMMTLKEHGVAP